MIANAFRMVIGYHLCLTSLTRPTPKALKTELDMEKGFKITYLIGNSLSLHPKRVEVISDTFSFLSDENQKNARRV